jgi:two-component system, NarL family, response regulator LiaR
MNTNIVHNVCVHSFFHPSRSMCAYVMPPSYFSLFYIMESIQITVHFFKKHKLSFIYGISLASLLFFLKWLELRFVIFDHALEVYIGAVAVLFTALGIWLALKLMQPKTKTVLVEKEVYISQPTFQLNEKELSRLGISKRELEVLELMAAGLSNNEIAERLFVSLNTVKTHSSNLFLKLDVKRRTQAVDKAKKLGFVA